MSVSALDEWACGTWLLESIRLAEVAHREHGGCACRWGGLKEEDRLSLEHVKLHPSGYRGLVDSWMCRSGVQGSCPPLPLGL